LRCDIDIVVVIIIIIVRSHLGSSNLNSAINIAHDGHRPSSTCVFLVGLRPRCIFIVGHRPKSTCAFLIGHRPCCSSLVGHRPSGLVASRSALILHAAMDPPDPKTPFPKRLPTEAEWEAAFDYSRGRDYSRGGPPYTPAAEASAASGGSGGESGEAEDMDEEAVDPGAWHRPLPDACCCGRPWMRQWAHSPQACAEWGLGIGWGPLVLPLGTAVEVVGLPGSPGDEPAEVGSATPACKLQHLAAVAVGLSKVMPPFVGPEIPGDPVGSPGDESGDEDDIMADMQEIIQRAIQEELHAEINALQDNGWVLSRADWHPPWEHHDFGATREEEIQGRRWLTLAHTDRLPEALRWNLRKVQAEGDGRLTMSDIRRELLTKVEAELLFGDYRGGP
jgi:hypothetical protein